MEKKWFEGYGFIEWLDPKQYYAEPWKYIGFAFDEDDETDYDIVRNFDATEYRYTIV